MAEPMSPERFAFLAERAGLDPATRRRAVRGTSPGAHFLERFRGGVRRRTAARDRAAEPAHIFSPRPAAPGSRRLPGRGRRCRSRCKLPPPRRRSPAR